MKDKFKQYTEVSYSGRKLLEEYSLDTVGTWQVRGEDANCDMGGSHYMPVLGVFDGRLEDVIRYAVELPSFWQWGGGGDFQLISVKPITAASVNNRNKLLNEKKELEARIAKIEKELS